MTSLWIVHRAPRERQALARLVGATGAGTPAPGNAVVGAPGDPAFDESPPPSIVVLGLVGLPGSRPDGASDGAAPADFLEDWEAELEFVHRQRARHAEIRWILVGPPDAAEAAERLFDQVSIDFLAYPPHPRRLRERLELPTGGPAPLSRRSERDAVAARFRRWFGDGPPELLRALDPRLAGVPILVRGEPGSGRGIVLEYVHHFGGTADGSLLRLPCAPDTEVVEFAERLRAASRSMAGAPRLCCWLDEVGELSRRVQRELAAWLELTRPAGVRQPVRWVASLDEGAAALEPALQRALGTIELRVPAVREQPERIAGWVEATAHAWCEERRVAPRAFAEDALEVLREYPWPGNLRELQSLIEQTLAACEHDPVRSDDLVLDGVALAPVDAAEIATLLPDDATAGPADARDATEAGPRAGAGPWLPGSTPAAPTPEPPPLADAGAPAARSAGATLPARAAAEEANPPLETPLASIARALSTEVRKPLRTLQTFAELLPKRFDDPNFRSRFAEMVVEDIGRMQRGLGRLEDLASLPTPAAAVPVDLAEILEALLEERRSAFRQRDLLVLKELDTENSEVIGDPVRLRLAFDALLERGFEAVPPRGDLYVATRRQAGLVRVLLRFQDRQAETRSGARALEQSLAWLVATHLLGETGGRLALGESPARERLILAEVPAR